MESHKHQQKIRNGRQRWLAPFIRFGHWCWTSPKAAWSIFISLACVLALLIAGYNLMFSPDAGYTNPKLASHVTRLSTKVRRSTYSEQQLKYIFNNIDVKMTDRQALNVGRANEAKLVPHSSQTGEWAYTNKEHDIQVFVAFNDGRVISKTYNTPDYTAEVRWDCDNGSQVKVLQNGQPLKSGKELQLP